MLPSQIKNIEIHELPEKILLIHQIKASSTFTRCDGLIILPKEGRNSQSIILDLNLEPQYIKTIHNKFGPVSDYVCTHTHLDHSAHVHIWEELGVKIHAPYPEHQHLLNPERLLENFGFLEAISLQTGRKFFDNNGFKACQKVNSFNPGDTLVFDAFKVKTIPFLGHSLGHVGLLLESEKILHVSCLGFDKTSPDVDGFGPWYGFKICMIEQYYKDIDTAEEIFLNKAEFLTSSHSYIVRNPDRTPFDYMRRKIQENQERVDKALKTLNFHPKSVDDVVNQLLKLDIFFPKRKMSGFLLEIYTLWESWIIRKHVERSKYLK